MRRTISFCLLNPCFLVALFLAGGLSTGRNGLPPDVDLQPNRTTWIRGWINRSPQASPDRLKLRLAPLRIRQQGNPVHYSGDLEISIFSSDGNPARRFNPPLSYGEILEFQAFLREPPQYLTPGAPNLIQLAWSHGISHRVRIKSPLQIRRKGFHLRSVLLKPPHDYLERFLRFCRTHLSRRAQSILLSSFLGQRDLLRQGETERIQNLGIYHLFVVSGFHVSLVALLLHRLSGRRWAGGRVLTLAGVWFYVLLVGASLPTLRAGVMTTVFYLALAFGRCGSFLNTVGISALVLLFCTPRAIFSVGFQFSYLCLFAIGLVVLPQHSTLRSLSDAFTNIFSRSVSTEPCMWPRRARWFRFWMEETFQFWPRKWILRAGSLLRLICLHGGALLLCCFTIQLFTLPLALQHNNRWIWTQWLGNLLLVPLFSLLIGASLGLFLVFWLPWAGFLAGFLDTYTKVLVILMERLQEWSFISFVRQPEGVETLVYFGLLLFPFILSSGGLRALSLLSPLWLWMAVNQPAAHSSGDLQITMLDVGQGESIHVRYPNGKDALIDTGGFTYPSKVSQFVGERLVSRYLWSQRVQSLEYVLLTHPHADHVQGFSFIQKAFPIERLLFHELGQIDSSLPQQRLLARDYFALAGVEHRILHPPVRNLTSPWEGNDASVVMLMSYGEFKILFTGDIQRKVEKNLAFSLEPVTVLKAAHHGADTSNSLHLLRKTRPRVALISAGRNNAFGHPAQAVLDRFTQIGTIPLSTHQWGTLRIESDGSEWRVLSFSPQDQGFRIVPLPATN